MKKKFKSALLALAIVAASCGCSDPYQAKYEGCTVDKHLLAKEYDKLANSMKAREKSLSEKIDNLNATIKDLEKGSLVEYNRKQTAANEYASCSRWRICTPPEEGEKAVKEGFVGQDPILNNFFYVLPGIAFVIIAITLLTETIRNALAGKNISQKIAAKQEEYSEVLAKIRRSEYIDRQIDEKQKEVHSLYETIGELESRHKEYEINIQKLEDQRIEYSEFMDDFSRERNERNKLTAELESIRMELAEYRALKTQKEAEERSNKASQAFDLI